MSSANFIIQSDALSNGGATSTSTNFGVFDVLGEFGAGDGMTSTNYGACVGMNCGSVVAVAGGGGPPPDTTPPVISGISTTNVTRYTARVNWLTNKFSDSTVNYGLTASYGLTVTDNGFATTHFKDLTGLTEATLYHFQVCSRDGAGNLGCSGDNTFSTVDLTPPVISSVVVSGITGTSATITWTTNKLSSTLVDYGLVSGPPYALHSTDNTLVTSHSATLTGLNSLTTYHYIVRSVDGSGNEGATTDATFNTLDITPPVISAVTVTSITATGATVTWTTNKASDSKVDYGLTNAYGSSASSATMVTSHSVALTGLAPATLYNYKVTSVDAATNSASSPNATFSTVKPAPPVISNVQVTAITTSGATITWTTTTLSDSLADYGKTAAYGSSVTDAALAASHSLVLSGLATNTLYHYKIRSVDAYGQFATYGDATFSTSPDLTPPGPVTNFTAAPGNAQISLNWANPTDPDLMGVKIVRKTTGNPTGPNDGTSVYSGSGTSIVDVGLMNGTTYHYGAFAYDTSNNYSTGVFATGAPVGPPDTTPPGNVTNLTATPGDAEARLNWTNPTDPDWASTRVVRKTGGNPTGPADGFVVYQGTAVTALDTLLTNGTVYDYGVYTYDLVGNVSSGAFVSATPAANLPPPPPEVCTDTDGGRVYGVRGTVTVGQQVFTDSCANATDLIEHYCQGNVHASEIKTCDPGFGCSDGACVPVAPIAPVAVCGNGICENTENPNNCPQDCPIPSQAPPAAVPPPSVSSGEAMIRNQVRFFATTGNIELKVTGPNQVNVLTSMVVRIYVPDAALRKPLREAVINFNGNAYQMQRTASYEAAITMPAEPDTYRLTMIVNYQDGSSENEVYDMVVNPAGYVYETGDNGIVRVAGAKVTLLANTGGNDYAAWDGATSGQANPQLTDSSGTYRFIVPAGLYKMVAEKDGYYSKFTLPFPVGGNSNVINTDLQLIKQPPPPVKELEQILKGNKSNAEKAGAIAGVIEKNAVFAALVTADQVREVRNNPIVQQQTEQVAAPTVAAVAAANVAAAGAATANAVPYAMYLYSFLAHPTLLIARRRRKKWGIVYNSLSKLPVDLVIVRLLDAATGRILRSAVTDKDGRYFFIVQPGTYKIAAAKAGYIFPTSYLRGQQVDVQLADLYHGEVIQVTEETIITANIPLDPTVAEKPPRRIILENFGRAIQKNIGLITIVAMAIAVYITPRPVVIGMFLGNILFYVAFKRLSVAKRPKSWGIVYDDRSKKPVRNVIARVFEARYNKLLETQITDTQGHYSFLVGNNVYFVTFEKAGYEKQQHGPIDLLKMDVKKKAERAVTLDVPLVPAKPGAAKRPEPPKSSLLPPPPAPMPPIPPSAPAPSAPPAAPAPAPAPTLPPVTPAVPKLPWELEMIQKMKSGQVAPPKPAASPTVLPTAPSAPAPSAPPAAPAPAPAPAATTEPPKLVQDVGQAHPEVRLIQDTEHAHPGEKPPTPPEPTDPNKTDGPALPRP